MNRPLADEVLLVFPPVWLPESPFLSTPALTSYLKTRGINVHQHDLNSQFWKHFYEPDIVCAVYSGIQEKWARLKDKPVLSIAEDRLAATLAGVVSLPEGEFASEVSEEVITRSYYRDLIMGVSQYHIEPNISDIFADLDFEVQNYHDFLFSDISYSLYAHSSDDLLKTISEGFDNPYKHYFTQIVRSNLNNSIPKVIGISIVAVNQVIPAFTLATELKKIYPETHVVIGGSWCTQVHKSLSKRLLEFPCVDSMVIYEGEEPLYQLCKAVFNNSSFQGIPNLYYKDRNDVVFNREHFEARMNDLSTPDYDDLPLDSYDIPACVPIQASRGCYWGKCTFCSYPTLEPRFKLRSVDKLVDDIYQLHNKFGIKRYSFTDALISPSFAKGFSDRILSSGLDIEWVIFARFERAFTQHTLKTMARSGCKHISWGLESGSQRILQLIDKNIDLEHARNILRFAASSGIHNRVLVMYGHPTETFAEAQKTLEFVRDNFQNIGSISFNFYHPEFNTPIESLAERYGIQLVKSERNDLSLGYKWPSLLSLDEKQHLCDNYESLSLQINARSDNSVELPQTVGERRELKEYNSIVQMNNNESSWTFLSQLTRDDNGKRVRRRYVVDSY